MLAEDRWERHYALSFALALHRAECEFLAGEQATAKTRLAGAGGPCGHPSRSRRRHPTAMEPSDRDIEVALDYLRRVGIAWSAQPTSEEVGQEYERMWRQIGERPIEALLDLPRMADPVACGTMDVLTVLVSPAWYIDESLRRLIIGTNGESEPGVRQLRRVVPRLHPARYRAWARLRRLRRRATASPSSASTWSNGTDLDRFKARVYLGLRQLDAACQDGPAAGCGGPSTLRSRSATSTTPALCRHHLLTHLLACGDPLPEVQREAEAGLEFARRARRRSGGRQDRRAAPTDPDAARPHPEVRLLR